MVADWQCFATSVPWYFLDYGVTKGSANGRGKAVAFLRPKKGSEKQPFQDVANIERSGRKTLELGSLNQINQR